MNKRPRLGAFFACDTGSNAFNELRAGLEALTVKTGLHLVVYDQEVCSDSGLLEKIERLIAQSICLIADVGADSSRYLNGNVMMEIGLARGLSRPILLITKNPDTLPANLKGRDIVKFPECLCSGSVEYKRSADFLRKLTRGLLEGNEVRIFNSQSREYIELLKKINNLSGPEWYVGPELRSFLRPVETQERWLHEVRRVRMERIELERAIRSERQLSFERNLQSHGCIDLYPLQAIKLNSWRGMKLQPEDKVGFISNAIYLLEHYPLYQMIFLKHNDRQKYWIKESESENFLIFEQWGYVDVRHDKQTGGLVISTPKVIQSFKNETEQLIKKGFFSRKRTVQYLRSELNKMK